jgi:CheY-like chemotaxis protein
MDSHDAAALRERIAELETLCAEVYVAAVELGLPQPLLNRLWIVAAHGGTSHTFDVEVPHWPAVPASRVHEVPPAPIPQGTPAPLPNIRLTDRPESREGSRAKAPQAELQTLRERRRVMVVDDDLMMLQVLVRILQRENYQLITAMGGPEALEKASGEAADVDLLITDYAMPELNGRELAEKIRGRWPDIKVLYQTGFSDMLFEHHAELEDGSAFLEKPFTARGLREAVRLLLFGVINPL